jgi:hypothetical protein
MSHATTNGTFFCMAALLTACSSCEALGPAGPAAAEPVGSVSPTTPLTEPTKPQHACIGRAAFDMAQAYRLATPMSDGRFSVTITAESPITRFVQANRDRFVPDGTAILCARAFGSRLIQSGLQSFDPHAGDRAIELWGSDAPEAAERVAREMNRSTLELVNWGQELVCSHETRNDPFIRAQVRKFAAVYGPRIDQAIASFAQVVLDASP